MTSERGASRWTIAALLAVVIGVIVSLGVAQGWFSGEGDQGNEAAAETGATTTRPPADPTTTLTVTSTAVPTTTTGVHPLCALHADLVTAIEGHLPVEDSEDLQAYNNAQIEFHLAAIEVLDPPESDGFESLLAWYEELADYYEPLDWNPSPGLEVLAENPPPQPSAEAVVAVTATLEDVCGIVPTADQPAP